MNRFRTQAYKPHHDGVAVVVDVDANVGQHHHHHHHHDHHHPHNNNNNNNNNGLLTKFTKRYSTLSSRLIRRHQSGRKGGATSPSKVHSGSYDMSGAHSDDHRLEIGAPVLISTTTLDADRFDVSAERLRQIGGGIAELNLFVRTGAKASSSASASASASPPPPRVPSSGSDNEVFVDALSSSIKLDDADDDHMIAVERATEADAEAVVEADAEVDAEAEAAYHTARRTSSPLDSDRDSQRTPVNASVVVVDAVSQPWHRTQTSASASASASRRRHSLCGRHYSRSTQSLHRSELKVFLQKAAPSPLSSGELLPRLPELYGGGDGGAAGVVVDVDVDVDADDVDAEADKENSSPSVQSKSVPNTPMGGAMFKSVDSLHLNASNATTPSPLRPGGSAFASSSRTSLMLGSSLLEDFDDLKSGSSSCRSLSAQHLFLSIDELNEIARHIDETTDGPERDTDLEYCQHRDNLRPSERRITLLKNKNARLISFNHNKEKLKKSWTDVKNWIGEERSKFKDVVGQKAPPALQRVAIAATTAASVASSTSRLNLNQTTTTTTTTTTSTTATATTMMDGRTIGAWDTPDSSAGYGGGGGGGGGALGGHETNHNVDEIHTDDDPDDGGGGDVAMASSFARTNTRHNEDTTTTKRHRREGQNGFEEMQRYIKQGADFGKELIFILQERVESELLYSKSLSKMANKLNKACRELPGSIAEAWRGVAAEMESRSDIHRQFSASLTDEIIKPLKSIVETNHKTRKSVESSVDKAARMLAEWRVSEAKAKKCSHTAARENEKLQDNMLDVRIQKSPSLALLHQGPNKATAEKELKSAEKDSAKLDNKRKKAEEAVKRADVEYYTYCVRAERARVDWEMAVLRGSSLLLNVEHQRLGCMKNFVSNYVRLTANMNPIVEGLVQRLQTQVDACNAHKDMLVAKNIRRITEGPSEQLLPDFYCEHTTLAMNRDRRKHALVKLLQLVKTDLERERRSRNGLKGLSQSLKNQDHQNITDKLYHIRSMLTYLEGARFKLHSALLELDHRPRNSHPLAQHIQITRDRNGLQQSILKVPAWLKNNDRLNSNNNSNGNGNSNEDDESVQENGYECLPAAMGVAAANNISCNDLHHRGHGKQFSRSKSNIETFSSSAQISLTSSAMKTKTIPLNLNASAYSDRGQADGGSNQHDSDFDEFSSQEDDDEAGDGDDDDADVIVVERNRDKDRERDKAVDHRAATTKSNGHSTAAVVSNGITQVEPVAAAAAAHKMATVAGEAAGANTSGGSIVLSRCKALYSYTPKLYDELELTPGDIIEVHMKQEDGWWLGALRNHVGIFPATYVEEFA